MLERVRLHAPHGGPSSCYRGLLHPPLQTLLQPAETREDPSLSPSLSLVPLLTHTHTHTHTNKHTHTHYLRYTNTHTHTHTLSHRHTHTHTHTLTDTLSLSLLSVDKSTHCIAITFPQEVPYVETEPRKEEERGWGRGDGQLPAKVRCGKFCLGSPL